MCPFCGKPVPPPAPIVVQDPTEGASDPARNRGGPSLTQTVKRDTLAVLASILFPGAGQALKGRWQSALLAAGGVFVPAALAGTFARSYLPLSLILALASLTFYVAQIFEAAREDPPT
jgi:hypothetical protein